MSIVVDPKIAGEPDINAIVPTQGGHSGDVLETDGSVVSWQAGGGGGGITALTGDVTASGSGSVVATFAAISGNPVSAATPDPTNVLAFDGASWINTTISMPDSTYMLWGSQGLMKYEGTPHRYSLGTSSSTGSAQLTLEPNFANLIAGGDGSVLEVDSDTVNLFSANGTLAPTLNIYKATSNHFASIKAPAAATTNTLFELPPTNGTSGYVLQTDGSGVTSWVAGGGGGFTNPMTTAGDIIIENATPAPDRLQVGATGDVLTVVGGLPSWQVPSVPSVPLNTLTGATATNSFDSGDHQQTWTWGNLVTGSNSAGLALNSTNASSTDNILQLNCNTTTNGVFAQQISMSGTTGNNFGLYVHSATNSGGAALFGQTNAAGTGTSVLVQQAGTTGAYGVSSTATNGAIAGLFNSGTQNGKALQVQDGTQGNAGDVLTSFDTNGSAIWQPPGANKSLDNLSLLDGTSVNIDLVSTQDAVVYDQSGTRTDGPVLDGTTNQMIAQPFTPTVNTQVGTGHFDIKNQVLSLAGNLFMDIYNDSAGAPGASIGTSNALDATTLNSGAYIADFTFGAPSSVPVSLTAGTPYWIVIYGSPDYNAGTDHITLQTATPTTNGDFFNGSVWASLGLGTTVRVGTGTPVNLGQDGAPWQEIFVNDLSINPAVNSSGAQVGTLTNSPTAGDPTGYITIKIAGVTSYIPFWQ